MSTGIYRRISRLWRAFRPRSPGTVKKLSLENAKTKFVCWTFCFIACVITTYSFGFTKVKCTTPRCGNLPRSICTQQGHPEQFLRLETSTHVAKCPSKPFQYLNGQESIIQLASFPGSGNTWVRHMLEIGSGFLTGSRYDDPTLRDEFIGESEQNWRKVITVKTHQPAAFAVGFTDNVYNWIPPNSTIYGRKEWMDYDASIQVLRNPFGSLLATFNFIYSGESHTKSAPPHILNSKIFDIFVQTNLKYWLEHAAFYLSREIGDGLWFDTLGKPTLLVYYEVLRDEPICQMERMFDFIKRLSVGHSSVKDMDPAAAAECAIKDITGVFRRDVKSNDPFQRLIADGNTNTVISLRKWVCRQIPKHTLPFWRADIKGWDC